MPQQVRIDDATEKIMGHPEVEIIYPTLKGLLFQDKVRELVKFAVLDAMRKANRLKRSNESEKDSVLGSELMLGNESAEPKVIIDLNNLSEEVFQESLRRTRAVWKADCLEARKRNKILLKKMSEQEEKEI